MTDLSREDLGKFLRQMLDEVLSQVRGGMVHTVWEQKEAHTGNLKGLLIYRSAPQPTTPVVVWIDDDLQGRRISLVASSATKTEVHSFDMSLENWSATARRLREDILKVLQV